MILPSILDCIGNTPLLQLSRLTPETSARLLVKCEYLNPGGSIKIRPALHMVRCAKQSGMLHKNSILCEATSGNQGIALAMIGAAEGYKVIIVMPENMSLERQQLIRAYGATVVLTPAGANIGEAIHNAECRVREIAAENPSVFVPSQFDNPNNPLGHHTTAREIIQSCDTPIDAFVSGFGTGGTLSGIGALLKESNPNCHIICAEPENAAILSGNPIGHHVQMGIGDGFVPKNLNVSLIDSLHIVSDADALATAKAISRTEGLFVGVSSGTNVFVALQYAALLGPEKTVVTVLPDDGMRYLSLPEFTAEG